MLTTNRDCKHQGAMRAIPTMGEIEGRMAVLEVVAQSALTHALEEGDACVDAALLAEIRQAMFDTCRKLKLDQDDSESAMSFAEELIEAAVEASNVFHQ